MPDMHLCSDIPNPMSIGVVRELGNARYRRGPYNLIVLDWYLKEWLDSLQMSQADLVRATDYPKAKVSDLVRGEQRYNRDILNDIAKALNIYPYELLMSPENAMTLRQMKIAVEQFARVPYGGTVGDLPGETDERQPKVG
jgi:transcriptional regulator with XRE-family HTH domain